MSNPLKQLLSRKQKQKKVITLQQIQREPETSFERSKRIVLPIVNAQRKSSVNRSKTTVDDYQNIFLAEPIKLKRDWNTPDRVKFKALISEDDELYNPSNLKFDHRYQSINQKYNHQERRKIWRNPDIQGESWVKKYRMKKKQKYDQPYFPDGMNIEIDLSYANSSRKSRYSKADYYQPFKYPDRLSPAIRRYKQLRRYRLVRFFRKAAHSILFIIFLKRFCQKMRIKRKNSCKKFLKQNLQTNLLLIRDFFIDNSLPFFKALASHKNFDFTLYERDDLKVKKQKIRVIKELLSLQLECVETTLLKISTSPQVIKTIFELCKHGSYAPYFELLTRQELNRICVSQLYGSISADRHLQNSQIISLILIKMLLCNVLLQPGGIEFLKMVKPINLVIKNLHLIASICYEIFCNLQNRFLLRISTSYNIGNWKYFHSKSSIKPAQSMSFGDIDSKVDSEELIFGLLARKFIREAYETSKMGISIEKLENLVIKIHKGAVDWHQRIIRRQL